MNIDNITNIVTYIGLSLTVIALALSCYQLLEARRQTTNLKFISDSLSTKYLGPFPEFIPEIGNLLSDAKKKILIACNVPAYGIYSNYENWLSAKHAIDNISHNLEEFVCVFPDEINIRKWTSEQFAEAKNDWNRWSMNQDEMKKLQNFSNSCCGKKSITDFEEFINRIVATHKFECSSTYRNADINELNQTIPMYLWIVDDRKAIFVVATTIPNFSAEGFLTTDQRLISLLENIHKEYCKKSTHLDING